MAAALYLLDTNIAGYIVSGRSKAAREMFKETFPQAVVSISTITEAEILSGVEAKREAVRLRSPVEALLQMVRKEPWDSAAAQAYARLRSQLKVTGKRLAEMDLLIASHALALGATLVSHNAAFQHVAGFVSVVDWATDL